MQRHCIDDEVQLLAAYRYNGLGQRIMWQYDVNSSGTLTAEEQYYFVHDAKGRVVASMRHTGSGDVVTIQEAFVYHAAGAAGRGVSSPSESAILRDVDSDYKWATASDNVLNVRTFYVQNWKGDVVAVLDSDGKPLERIRYTAFGTPSAHPIADVDGNGKVEAADMTKFLDYQAGGANATVFATTDLNADGLFPDDADLEFFDDEYVRLTNNGATTRTFGMNSMSGVRNREGYEGYEWDSSSMGWHAGVRILDSQSSPSTSNIAIVISSGNTDDQKEDKLTFDDCFSMPTVALCVKCCEVFEGADCAAECARRVPIERNKRRWTDLYDGCIHKNPAFLTAYIRVITACGKRPRIRDGLLGGGAAYCCKDNSIILPREPGSNPGYTLCSDLTHELIHAAERCERAMPCDSIGDDCGGVKDCYTRLAGEARAMIESRQVCGTAEEVERGLRARLSGYFFGCDPSIVEKILKEVWSPYIPCR